MKEGRKHMKRIETCKPNSKSIAKKLMASALALTICAPYLADSTYTLTSYLKANAGFFGDTGGSASSGSSYTDTEKGVGDKNLGYRFYIYDAKNKEIVRKSSGQQCLVDVLPVINSYSADQIHNTTRLGKADSDTPTIKTYNDYGILKSDEFQKVTNGYHGTGTFGVRGDEFYNWMTTPVLTDPETGKTLVDNRCILIIQMFGEKIYQKCYTNDYYLIVEPTIRAHVLTAPWNSNWTFADSTSKGSMYDTWASWYDNLADYSYNGGALCHIKADIGNGFYLREDYSDTLGIAPKGSSIVYNATANRNDIAGKGYGMGVYYCTVNPTPPNDDVINTYDIKDKPDHPSQSEKPSDPDTSKTVYLPDKNDTPHEVELKNSGDTNVIKVYMDAYVDKQNSPDINKNYSGDELNKNYYTTKKKYTGIEQVGVYGTKSTTKEVVVQDEFSESGYHLVGWETSLSDWEVSGNNIVLANTSGSEAWNGNNWLQVNSGELKINEGLLRKKGTSPTATTDKNRARYNTTNISISKPRAKLGTIEGADSVVNHKWDYKATDGAIVGK